MACAQPGGFPCDVAIDADQLDAESSECRIDDLGATRAERTDDHLCVHARSDQQAVTPLLEAGNQTARRSVVRVVAVEEADQDVGVERYRSHSSRSRSR